MTRGDFGGKFIFREVTKLWFVSAAARWRAIGRSEIGWQTRACECSREIRILTANPGLTAEHLNFKGTRVSGKENRRRVILIPPQKADPCIRVRVRPVRLSRRPRAVLAKIFEKKIIIVEKN